MMFRNTVRLVLTNFSNVWKLLLYYIITTIVLVGILYPIVNPVFVKLSQANVFSDIQALFNAIFSEPNNIVKSANQILVTIGQVLKVNANIFMANYILFGFIVVIVAPFMYGLGELAINEVLYGFMTSQTQYGFTASFIKKIGKSSLLQLAKMLFIIPLNVIIVFAFYGIVKLCATGLIVNIFLSILILIATFAFIAFKNSLFGLWAPCMAVHNVGPYKSLCLAIRSLFHNFWSVFSTAITLLVVSIAANFIFGVFTFTAGFVITLPLSIFALYVFNMVAYFSNQGMRFYVYPDMFITPKKIKEQETIKKLKFYL